jgi:glyoxylase-like metal-dependent hydrolase (beta-lactamase superfamily II)
MLIKPTRRDLLKLMAAAPAFAMPASARAQLGAPEGGNPTHFRFSVGDIRLTILSDGYFKRPTSGIGINADPADVQAFLASHFLSTQEGFSHTNHLLIETNDATVLVDVGSGDRLFETTGNLLENMARAGVDPDEITHVVITHAHPDHILGIRDDFDEAIFPGADYIIGQTEFDYWMQDDLVNKVDPADQQFVLGAVNSLNVDGADWTLATDGHEVTSGVYLVSTPGHTPGHMSVRIDSGDKSLIALGDAMTNAYTNFAHPEWFNGSDDDGDLTVQTRLSLLEMAATDRIAILGYHFPFPGVGHVQRDKNHYRFIPALWQFEA